MRVYLSGAITGVPNKNWEQFEEAEKKLTSMGYVVINPLKLDHSNCKKYIDYLRNDVRAMKTCQAIYLLRGCRFSRGSRIELRIARKHGIAELPETVELEPEFREVIEKEFWDLF